MFLVDALRGLLRPTMCLACGVPEAWPCCAGCLPAEPGAVGPWVLAADPDLPVWALGPYRDALRTAVLAGKLDGQPAALTELGRRLGTALAGAGAGADLVTYVAAGRVAGPPRDHTQQIATGVATTLDLPLVDLLAPAGGRDLGRARGSRRPNPDRPGLLRRPDPDGPGWSRAGQPPPPRPPPRPRRRLAGGRVLLVDDLTTTGGTLAGAAAALRDAGARTVEAAVLAASPSALRPDAGPLGAPNGSRLVPPHRGPPRPGNRLAPAYGVRSSRGPGRGWRRPHRGFPPCPSWLIRPAHRGRIVWLCPRFRV
jgi:predicted amidophosphoribosyltransferase